MARAGLFDHRKFQRLVYILKEPIPHVAGYLECLWSAAYQQRCDLIGDVLDVELSAKFPGEPGKLADALVKSGFLELHGDVHYVHDLVEHAPQYVRRVLKIMSPGYPQASQRLAKGQPEASQQLASGLQGKSIKEEGKERVEEEEVKRSESPPLEIPKIDSSTAKAVDLAERFWFYQRGGKEDRIKLCDGIEAMIECGFSVDAILAEIERPSTSRDRSERFWKLKDRLEKASKSTVPKTASQAIDDKRNRIRAMVKTASKGADP